MSVGSVDRGENETKYLQDALTLVNNMLKEEVQEVYDITAVDKEEAMCDEPQDKGLRR